MFTGIVEELGTVRSVHGHRLEVACSVAREDGDVGASVAVAGVCLTVVARGADTLAFDLSEETIARTGLHRLVQGATVNLERPVTLAARLGGHVVQGHVDGVGEIVAIEPDPAGGASMRIAVPVELRRFTVEKGSIAIDGVSLTVAALHDDGITVALIPHTLAATTLGAAAPGDPVNLEVDMIARYVERLMSARFATGAGAMMEHGGAQR